MKYEKYAGGYRVSGTLPNGVRLRKSLKGLNRAQAKDYVRRLTDEATVEVVTGKKPRAPTTFAQAAEAWLEFGKYLNGIEKAITALGDTAVNDITVGDIMRHARSHWSSAASINRLGIAPARAVLNYAYEMEWRATPMKVRQLEEIKKKKKTASPEWLAAFVTTAQQMDYRYLGYGELAMMMALTGRRIDEMIKLRWADVDWEQERILLERTKNGEDQWCAVPAQLAAPLRLLRAEQARIATSPKGEVAGLRDNSRMRLLSGRMFCIVSKESAWKRWKEICAKAEIDYVTPHGSGRHTFATRLNAEGWTANDIAAAGGWKSPALVQKVYIHSEADSRRAAEVLSSGIGNILTKSRMDIVK